ncbi:MAG: hypothetical protein FJ026_10075 [Chloroflexi bacterium]|nr:hypothetical protein [Chloroflexota bacterium]
MKRKVCCMIVCIGLWLWLSATVGLSQGTEFQADFETPDVEVWQLHRGWQVALEGRESRNHVLRGQGQAWAGLWRGEAWQDYTLQFRVRLLAGHLRAHFRVSEQGSYVLGLSEGGLYLDRGDADGRSVRLTQEEARFGLEQWRYVEVLAQAGHLQVSVDGVLWIKHLDEEPLRQGSIAFESLEGAWAQIDDVQVMIEACGEAEVDLSGLLALRAEGQRLAADTDWTEPFSAAEETLRAALAEAANPLRQAEDQYRAAIADTLWGQVRQRMKEGDLSIADEQLEYAWDLLEEAQLPTVSTTKFLQAIEKVKFGLTSGQGEADLTVKLWAIPGSPLTGLDPSPPLTDRPTHLSILVENQGFTAVTQTFTITLQVDGELFETWTFLPAAEGEDPAHAQNPLQPGGSRTYTTDLTFAQKGQHTLRLEVDPAKVVPEADEQNNILQFTATWQDPPNLKVKSIAPVGSAGGGQKSTWKIEIENAGKGDVATPFLTVFWPGVPGGSQENFWCKSLAAGHTATFTSTQWFQSWGTFTITATVDASWAVAEVLPDGEKDNEWAQQVTLSTVDLAVTKVSISPTKVVSWQPVTFTFTVKNLGTGNATQPFKVRVYPGTVSASGLSQPTGLSVKSLSANQTVTLTHSVTLRPGKYDLSVQVDADGVYFEKDRNNNSYVSYVECEGMWNGEVYDVGNNPSVQELTSYINNDPQLEWFQKKVALTALQEAVSPLCGDDARNRYDASGYWCSEFARWVYLQAGMNDIDCCWGLELSDVTLNKELVKLFDHYGRFKWRSKGQVTIQTVGVGDYLSWTTKGKKKNHAVICVGVNHDRKFIWTVQGNVGDCVWYGTEDYFPDGTTCNADIDGVGKIDAGLFP